MNDLYSTARLLRDQGIACIPCRDDKTPNIPTWKPYMEILPSDEDLKRWFSDPKSTHIAIVAGQVHCIDIDTKNHSLGTHFNKEFAGRANEFGLGELLAALPVQKTPSGGLHILFKSDTKERNQVLARGRIRKNKYKPIIETRGEGGYFLISPSPGYEFLSSDVFNIPFLNDEDRSALVELARTFDEGMDGSKVQLSDSISEPSQVAQNGGKTPSNAKGTNTKNLKPGDAYNESANLPGLLRDHGWTQLGNTHYWRRPGKDKGVSATFNAMPNCPGRLWVFSTSTEFEAEKAYTPFQCYAILEHGGDFAKAAKVLASQGFGERLTPNQTDKQDGSESGSDLEPSRFPPILSYDQEEKEEWTTPPELIHGMLYRGAKGMVAGPSKSRKTFLLTDLAISVASGLNWMGCATSLCPVIYINLELQSFAFRTRRRQIQKAKGHLKNIPLFTWHLRGYQTTLDAIRKHLIDVCLKEGIGLIVLDPIYKLGDAGDENNAKEVGRLLNAFEAIGQECNASTIFAHHYAKGTASDKSAIDRASGSGVWARDPDCMVFFSPHEEDDSMIVETSLRNFEGMPPFCVRWDYPLWEIDTQLDPLEHKGSRKKNDKKQDSLFNQMVLKKILTDLNYFRVHRANVAEIAEAAGVSERTVWSYWKIMKNQPTTGGQDELK